MGKQSAGQAPAAPNPSNVSAEQTTSNVNTAIANSYMNRVNQVTPDGSLTYNKTGTVDVGGNQVPTWEAITKLSPANQKLYETQQGISQGTSDLANSYVGRIKDATAQPYNFDGMPAAPVYDEAYRQKAMNSIIARNQPQMDRDRAALEQKLANQGISQGTEAWNNAQNDYGRAVNDFRLGADNQAGSAAAQQYALEGNTRDRAISEYTNQRTQPINEVAALMGTGNGVQQPSFAQVPQTQVAGTDVSGNYNNAYQGQLAAWSANQKAASAQNTGMMSGLFGLGTSGIGAAGMYFGGAALL